MNRDKINMKNYLLNHGPTHINHKVILDEKYIKKKPSAINSKNFGCICYVLKEKKSKLESKIR